jgi:hypothetical protein
VEALVPLLPRPASRAVTVGAPTSWPFTLAVRRPGLGKVRLGVSVRNAALTGTEGVWGRPRVAWNAPRLLPV